MTGNEREGVSGGVELRGLGKIFPNGVEAVSGVNLSIKAGEFLAVVGPSGSGKSTLLRLIAGLETPSTGSIAIGGAEMAGRHPRDRDVAMVFQDPALFPYLSVFDNLAFGLRARRVARTEVKQRVESVAGMLGLADLLDRRPATLSGGQRQRVALGRAVVRRPAVFLFDEPLSRLDAPLRASLRSELHDLHRRLGATMILVTHDQAEALATGDRVAVMERGRLVQVGRPNDVHDRPATRFVGGFLGSPPMILLPCEILDGEEIGRVGIEGAADRLSFLIVESRWAASLALRRGEPIILGVRPEDVRLARGGDGSEPGITWLSEAAEVIRVEYLGHESIVTLGLWPYEVSCRSAPSATIRVGEAFHVGIVLDRVSWFDPKTGAAITPDPRVDPASAPSR